MTIEKLKDKWPLYVVMLAASVLIIFCTSCPPTVRSLYDTQAMVTRTELQIELDRMLTTAQMRMTSLDKQQAIRDAILKNALLMVETGTLNPIGIATALFGAYGLGHGASKINKSLKKHKKGAPKNVKVE